MTPEERARGIANRYAVPSLADRAIAAIATAIREAEARGLKRAKVLENALRPFAEAATHLHPSQSDDGLTLDGIEVRHWRAAAAAMKERTP